MRIVHVISRPDGGGAERLVRELTARLPSHGLECRALYFVNPNNVSLSWREKCIGLKSPRSLRGFWKLKKAINELVCSTNDTNVIHAHTTVPLYLVSMLTRQSHEKKIFTEHNTHNRRRQINLLRPVERHIYSTFDKVVCISKPTQKNLLDWLAISDERNWSIVIPNGSRMLNWHTRMYPMECGIRLVSVGSLTRQKGFDVGLKAVSKNRHLISKYTIVGAGPDEASLRRLVIKLGLQDVVRMVGYQEDVEAFFHDADLGLIPSRWEGFGLAAVEALSTGLPLVATDVPGMGDLLYGCQAVKLVKPDSVVAASNGLVHAIKHLVGREQIAYAARQRAESYTIEQMVSSYAKMYQELIFSK